MRFIDWLKASQTHPEGGLPIIGATTKNSIDLETGEQLSSYMTPKKHEGSYSSSINVRCDGYTVLVDGNPSKWGRPDNLFGYATLAECINVYNTILKEFGLPPFTPCTTFDWLQSRDNKPAQLITDGAIFHRVDMTENMAVGRGNELPFLRALSTQTIGKGKHPFLYPDGNTLDWGKKSTLWYQKLYIKAAELEMHLKNVDPTQKEYVESLIEFCKEQGIVRNEREFKSKFLRRHNLCFYGLTRESDFNPHLTAIETLIGRLEMSTSDYQLIASQLLEKGVVDTLRAANTTQAYALSWMHGHLAQLSKSQYYEHKRRLLQIGLDISVPFDATKGLPQIKRTRDIHVSNVAPPEWYRMPTPKHLKLVA